jgi:hypothetical protein
MTINIAVAVAEGLVMAADSWVQMANSAGKVSTTHSSAEWMGCRFKKRSNSPIS